MTDFLQLPGRLPQPMEAAFAMNCLLHVPPADQPRVLKAVHDVLTPEGLFFLGKYGGIEFQGVRAGKRRVGAELPPLHAGKLRCVQEHVSAPN